jgi:predicted nucleotidyltransferase
MKDEIRFGIMCESLELRTWEIECLKKTLESGNSRLALIILPKRTSAAQKETFFHQLSKYGGPSKLLYCLYERLFVGPKLRPVVFFPDILKEVQVLFYCQERVEKSFEFFHAEDIEKIKKANLDFILLLSGFAKIQEEILNAPRYGIWSYYHGDKKNLGRKPCAFWEIYFNEDAIGSVLYKLTPNPEDILILREGYFKINKNSYPQNLHQILSESACFVSEVCQDIRNDLAGYIFAPALRIKISGLGYPGNLRCLKVFFKIIINNIRSRFLNGFFTEQWNIGVINCPVDKFIEEKRQCPIRWLFSPKKTEYYADPFIFRFDNKNFILYEYYNFIKKMGNISAAVLEENCTREIKKNCLEKTHHVSYPFVFRNETEILMLAEEWRIKRLVLYKARNFPIKWEEKADLLNDVLAVDPIIFNYNNYWWLFFTQKDKNPDSRLFVYYADNLLGPWKPHKKNPVKTHICSSRSAGNILFYKGNILRPAQDNSATYGGKVVLNRINRLSQDEFEEEPFLYIKPKRNDKFGEGIHTINISDEIIVIDGKRKVFSPLQTAKSVGLDVQESKLVRKIFERYHFVDVPKPIERKTYLEAIEDIKDCLAKQRGVISIYQIGSIAHPGISDIDLFIILEDDFYVDIHLGKSFRKKYESLITHSFLGISKSHFIKYKKYLLWHNFRHLWGESLISNERIADNSDLDRLRIQAALEYLIENYIDFVVHKETGVIKLRPVLQHLKAIKYDLEYLNVSTGDFFDAIKQVIQWIDRWFDSPIPSDLLSDWIDYFYPIFHDFLESRLRMNTLYVPKNDYITYTDNIRIKFGNTITYEFLGFSLPRSISSLHKKIFNLNLRFNSFMFYFPFDNTYPHRIYEDRYLAFKNIRDYTKKYLPSFSPPITSFASRILADED